jgi:uncharacterized protein involved in exopolysaccharide biosynthesis
MTPIGVPDERTRPVRPASVYASSEADRLEAQPITLLGLLNALLRQRRLILLVAASCALIGVTRALLTKSSYVSTASFSPSTPSSTSSLSGLASQLGVDIQSAPASQSPAFYSDLLKSRPLLQSVVEAGYQTTEQGRVRTKSLIDILGRGGDSPALRLERAVTALRSAMFVTMSQKTGVITFTVTAQSPGLAAQIGQKVLDAVNDFNVASRQGSASLERQFTERRVNEVRGELGAAESRLLAFQETNRSIQNDPALQMQQSRLTREVSRLDGLYASLTQSYESAKIDEVRDTPAITIIEHPDRSELPAARGRIKTAFVALILGLVLGSLLAVIREIIARNQASDPHENAEFARLRGDLLRDLRLKGRRPPDPRP